MILTPRTLSPARIVTHAQKWKLAELAVQYAEEAFLGIVHLMRSAQNAARRTVCITSVLNVET
jgi:hypothetical protein